MGQILSAMCYHYQQQSKGRLLYDFVIARNVEAIKAICRGEGVEILEWTDGEGKTPLIAACTSSDGFEVAKALIKLGANVNAYSPGPQGGTPLHYAAKGGLDKTAELLLSHGANFAVRNYDGQTALDVARMERFDNVVLIIESAEDEELAMALSSSVQSAKVSDGTQNSFRAVAPEAVDENVELAMALSASIQSAKVSNGNQSSDPAASTTAEDVELAMALSSSIQSTEDVELRNALTASIQSSGVPYFGRVGSSSWHLNTHDNLSSVVGPSNGVAAATPSAPPIPWKVPSMSFRSSPSCIICYEAPIDGLCNPCGHMAACMSCLNKIEEDIGECPVCRAKIGTIIKVYTV